MVMCQCWLLHLNWCAMATEDTLAPQEARWEETLTGLSLSKGQDGLFIIVHSTNT